MKESLREREEKVIKKERKKERKREREREYMAISSTIFSLFLSHHIYCTQTKSQWTHRFSQTWTWMILMILPRLPLAPLYSQESNLMMTMMTTMMIGRLHFGLLWVWSCKYRNVFERMYVCMHACIDLCINKNIYIYTYVSIKIDTYIHMYQ